MKILRVLLIENTIDNAIALKEKLLKIDSIKPIITYTIFQDAESVIKDSNERLDIVLFGEKVPSKNIIHLVRLIRKSNVIIPIFLLTKQSEARVAKKYQLAGIDDTFNIAEFDTPLFAWSFMSAVEQARLKKKAREYDALHQRVTTAHENLSVLIHDITNPLSVLRLALYHLNNPNISNERKDVFLKLLVDNIERLDTQMKALRIIRHQLHGKKGNTPTILSFNKSNSMMAQS